MVKNLATDFTDFIPINFKRIKLKLPYMTYMVKKFKIK